MAEIRGRHTNNPAKNKFLVKLTDDELNRLNECAKEKKISKSEVIRQGINKIFSELSK